MKRLIILIGIVLISFIGYTQVKNSLIDTSKIWFDVQRIYSSTPNFIQTYYRIYDSVSVNDVTYFKVFYKLKYTSDYPELQDIKNWKFSELLIRESSGKVYLKGSSTDSKEHILYDFNLKVQDSIFLNSKYWFVSSIDSVMINNNYKKRLRLKQANSNDYWIENVGSLYGLLNPGYNYKDYNLGIPQLICVKGKDEILYAAENCNCLEILSNKEMNLYGFQIFPTIVVKDVNIHSNSNSVNYSFKIFDLNGNLIRQDRFFGNQIIDCSALKNGMYLIHLSGENLNVIRKIIKE
ncbi:MAG: T9SS type A sorting domain-containing protein [Methylococcaceae bacterium]